MSWAPSPCPQAQLGLRESEVKPLQLGRRSPVGLPVQWENWCDLRGGTGRYGPSLPSGEVLLSGARPPRAQGLQVAQKQTRPRGHAWGRRCGGRVAVDPAPGVPWGWHSVLGGVPVLGCHGASQWHRGQTGGLGPWAPHTSSFQGTARLRGMWGPSNSPLNMCSYLLIGCTSNH